MRGNPKTNTYTPVGNLLVNLNFYWRNQGPADAHGCIPWTGGHHRQGYGMMSAFRLTDERRIMTVVHRITAMLTHNRSLTSRDYVIHTCSNPNCVTPAHIIIGDSFEKARVMYANGRASDHRGPRAPYRPRIPSVKKQNRAYRWTEEEILEKHGAICHICGLDIDLKAPRKIGEQGWELSIHYDHVVPVVEGGPDTAENVRPAHALCNLKKGRSTTSNARTEPLDDGKNSRANNGQIFRTSPDYMTNSRISHPSYKSLVPNSQIANSNKLKESETKGFTKEIKVPMRKWEDDGDSLAGFGLVEPKDAPQPVIRKSDPKTRGKRPEHEWTAMDVAAEFSYQVGRKYPLLPGTVSVKQLSGALRKFRTQYGTTPLVELELLRLFMGDERNFKDIGDEAPLLYKKYLSSFGTKMNQARENLGLNKVTAKIETTKASDRLTSSDGRTFQNSLSGRAQLERHEKRLKEAK